MLTSPTVNASWNLITKFLEWFGDLCIFFWQVARAAVTPPFEFRELFRQLDEIGSKSLPLVVLAGAATGIVLCLQARYSLTRFGAKSLLPAALVFSIIHETGPIITGLVVSGRAGAGIGAELASMKVTEQIDAIEASAITPYRLQAQAGVTDFKENMDAMKHNFFLRGYFKIRGYEDSAELAKNEIERLPQGTPIKEFGYPAKQLFDKQDSAKAEEPQISKRWR